MDRALNQAQPQRQRNRIRSIVIRYCGNKEARTNRLDDINYQHPENAYLVKYSPKYYRSLTLVMKPCHSLLSKIKKIKKLKRFTGKSDDQIPRANWFKILANNRKEVEEFPKMDFLQAESFSWAKVSQHAIKFFFHIKKLQLSGYSPRELAFWNTSAKHLRNLRNLIILEFYVHQNALKLIFKKLNGMTRLLGRLEMLKTSLRSDAPNDLLQNNNIFSALTHLDYVGTTSETFPISEAIPQIYKNLKSFSFKLGDPAPPHLNNLFGRKSRVLDIPPIPMRECPKLQSVTIHWSRHFSSAFWADFIPPTSLRNLNIKFNAVDMIRVVFKAEFVPLRDTSKYEDFFSHWKEINELDSLGLEIDCHDLEEILFTRKFITAMLKKVSRLISFKGQYSLKYHGIWRFEPFYVEEVPHLYEYLKKFQVRFARFESSISFDFGFLKPFKNLNNVDFQGPLFSWGNIGDAISLLERNSKSGEFLTLGLREAEIYFQEELKDLLKKISKVKKCKSNLKIVLGLVFRMGIGDYDEIKYLDQICEVVESKVMVKDLEISLEILNQNRLYYNLGEVRRVLEKYPKMKNIVIKIRYEDDIVEYIKRDGEKEQLLLYPNDL